MTSQSNPSICIHHLRSGSRRICLWMENGKQRRMYYSRWLWEKHYGAIPKGYVIHHKDGNPLNDTLDNYELLKLSEHSRLTACNPCFILCQEWKNFLTQHNKLDSCDKSKIRIHEKFNALEGNTTPEKLANIYKRYSMSQSQLSKISGISVSLLSRAMSGGRNFGNNAILKLLQTLDNIEKSGIKTRIRKNQYDPELAGKTLLENFRRDRGMSTRQLSNLSGVSTTAIFNIEQGYIATKPSTLKKLTDALGLLEGILG